MSQSNFYSAINKVNEVSVKLNDDLVKGSHSFQIVLNVSVNLDHITIDNSSVNISTPFEANLPHNIPSDPDAVIPVNIPIAPVCGENSFVNTGGENSFVNTPVNTTVNTLVPICGDANSSVNTADDIFVVDDFCDE